MLLRKHHSSHHSMQFPLLFTETNFIYIRKPEICIDLKLKTAFMGFQHTALEEMKRGEELEN
jgi:hypothetical protein